MEGITLWLEAAVFLFPPIKHLFGHEQFFMYLCSSELRQASSKRAWLDDVRQIKLVTAAWGLI